MYTWEDDRIKRLEDFAQKSWVGHGDAYGDAVFQRMQDLTADEQSTVMKKKRELLETVIAIDKNATALSPVGEGETQEHFPIIEKITTWLKDDVERKQ